MATPSIPSLDQLRIFTAVVDCGSFSGAGRQLDRSQPAVSYAIAVIEGQLGLTLFERGKRKPVLTQSGLAVLAYSRRLMQLADELAANAASLTAGLESALAITVDTFFPNEPLCRALRDLGETFPSVSVDLRICSRELALQQVIDGQAALGVGAIDVAWPAGIEAWDFGSVEIIGVVAPSHALAQYAGPIPTMVLRDSLQITNRSTVVENEARDVSVNSSRIWRVNGMAARVELLRLGLGWGYLPVHVASAEIEADRLVQLEVRTRGKGVQPWSLFFRAANPPGPAGRHFTDRLQHHAKNQKF